jgi:hypothetical protein
MKKFEEMEIRNQENTLHQFKRILYSFKKPRRCTICPLFEDGVDCSIFFPRAGCYADKGCPCDLYSRGYLIKKVKEIIKKGGKLG